MTPFEPLPRSLRILNGTTGFRTSSLDSEGAVESGVAGSPGALAHCLLPSSMTSIQRLNFQVELRHWTRFEKRIPAWAGCSLWKGQVHEEKQSTYSGQRLAKK